MFLDPGMVPAETNTNIVETDTNPVQMESDLVQTGTHPVRLIDDATPTRLPNSSFDDRRSLVPA